MQTRGAGVYTDDSVYGSLYYAKWDNDDSYEAQYEYLSEEDRLATGPTANTLHSSRASSSSSLPPPLPPPNRRRSSISIEPRPLTLGVSAWLHGAISREESERILFDDMRSGAYLVRVKEENSQWALSMVWKGMFVHHLIWFDPGQRQFYINEELFPVNVVTLPELIECLRMEQGEAFRVIEQDLRHPIAPPTHSSEPGLSASQSERTSLGGD